MIKKAQGSNEAGEVQNTKSPEDGTKKTWQRGEKENEEKGKGRRDRGREYRERNERMKVKIVFNLRIIASKRAQTPSSNLRHAARQHEKQKTQQAACDSAKRRDPGEQDSRNNGQGRKTPSARSKLSATPRQGGARPLGEGKGGSVNHSHTKDERAHTSPR